MNKFFIFTNDPDDIISNEQLKDIIINDGLKMNRKELKKILLLGGAQNFRNRKYRGLNFLKYKDKDKDKDKDEDNIKDKEYQKEYQKKYRELNRDKLLEKHKEYYELNKNKILEKHKDYYDKNRDILNTKSKKYYKNNKSRDITI